MSESRKSGQDLSPEEIEFLTGIRRAPGDEDRRLDYADWLDKRGDLRARYLRTECELQALPPDDAGRSENTSNVDGTPESIP